MCSSQSQVARLAQLVERKALNLVVVGSSPTVGVNFVFFPLHRKRHVFHRLEEEKIAWNVKVLFGGNELLYSLPKTCLSFIASVDGEESIDC